MVVGKVLVRGASATARDTRTITSGMVNTAVITFEFDSQWDGLTKTAVFSAGGVTRDVLNIGAEVIIPPEVLAVPGPMLYVGVHGTNADGTKVITSIRANLGGIATGADPSGDPSTDPSLPVWAQLQGQIDDLKENGVPSTGGSLPPVTEADEGKYLKVKNGQVVWGDLDIPEQYGLVTYDQDRAITIT